MTFEFSKVGNIHVGPALASVPPPALTDLWVANMRTEDISDEVSQPLSTRRVSSVENAVVIVRADSMF